MNEIKYQIVNIILLALLGSGIYWAFTTIDNGIYYDKNADIVSSSEQVEEVATEDQEAPLFDNTKTESLSERFLKALLFFLFCFLVKIRRFFFSHCIPSTSKKITDPVLSEKIDF